MIRPYCAYFESNREHERRWDNNNGHLFVKRPIVLGGGGILLPETDHNGWEDVKFLFSMPQSSYMYSKKATQIWHLFVKHPIVLPETDHIGWKGFMYVF